MAGTAQTRGSRVARAWRELASRERASRESAWRRRAEAVLREVFASHRGRLWAAACSAVVGAILLRETSQLLSSLQSASAQAYSASVVSVPGLNPVAGAAEIRAAWQVWTGVPDRDGFGAGLLTQHLLVDLLLFLPGYAALAYALLLRVGVLRRPAAVLVAAVAGADALETTATLVLLPVLGATGWPLVLVPVLSTAKWLAVVALGVVAVLAYAHSTDPADRGRGRERTVPGGGEEAAGEAGAPGGAPVPTDARSAGRRFRAHVTGSAVRAEDASRPALRLRPQIATVAAFSALVALPGGGPLDQIPDVLRAGLEDFGLDQVPAVLALALLVAAVVVSGWRGALLDLTREPPGPATGAPGSAPGPPPGDVLRRTPPLRSAGLAVLALAVAATGVVVAVVLPGPFPIGFLGIAVVLLAAAVVAPLGRWLHRRWDLPRPVRRRADALVDLPTGVEREDVRAWLGALAGVVGLAGAVGLLRATYRPYLVVDGFRLALAAALLLAFVGPPALHALARSRWLERGVAQTAGWALSLLALVLLLAAATWPATVGPLLGTTGTVAIVFAVAAVALGEVQRHAELTRPWEAVRWLRLGRRTPFVALLVLAWVMASLWNAEGGYHDARVLTRPHADTYPDVAAAWQAWLTRPPTCTVGTGPQAVRPLLLVAAPGGGIRAAYWTASGLDRLDAACPGSLFAVSGVSGGSVGTVAWSYARAVAADGGDPVSGRAVVAEMSRDDMLAAGVAALLARDVPASLVALNGPFVDRAAVSERVMERQLARATGRAPGQADLALDELAQDPDADPALILNGASATQGCRVLMTTVGGLTGPPAAAGQDLPARRSCQGFPVPPETGPVVSGALTATDGLLAGSPRLGSACSVDEPASLRATTAALLSARFPVVSPAGALRRCVSGVVTPSYVVDGGYVENSGLLTLLQVWEEIEPAVRDHNDAADVRVEPWVVVLDNHYRSIAGGAPVDRVPELGLPFLALNQARNTLSTAALEQVAVREMDGRLCHVSPRTRPSVAAPLGWVLSGTTRAELDEQLLAALGPPSPPGVAPAWMTGSSPCLS